MRLEGETGKRLGEKLRGRFRDETGRTDWEETGLGVGRNEVLERLTK